MLIQADVKGLEVVACAYLSQDPVLCQEVRDGVDFHESNKQRFNLPTRVVAKRFKFKLIYGASAYGYEHDSDFLEVGYDQKKWQAVIDEYYAKYNGVARWHVDLVRMAAETGLYTSPTGREYNYPPSEVVSKQWFWRPKILNYPVQGLGADLVMIARVSFWNRLNKLSLPCIPILSVHDSIVVDTERKNCYNIGKVMRESVRDVPRNFQKLFGKEFNLPLDAEIKVGHDLHNMEKIEC